MKFLKIVFYILTFVIVSDIAKSQTVTINELSILDSLINETSGIIYYNNKLISHNDSGNEPLLYEVDTTSGAILRTVYIQNATNIDWEDLAQDSLNIYIADIGNNSGDRTNLCIYKINKNNYLTSDTVIANTINFAYNNQTDFTTNTNNTRFDAEAISIFNDSILIFMKDWIDLKTRTYILPKTPGNYIAYQRDTFDCNGFITGSEYNTQDSCFMLCGYGDGLSPFIIHLSNFNNTNIFAGNVNKIDITNEIGASQTEGICLKNNNRYFLTREEFSFQTYYFAPKLYAFNYNENTLYTNNYKNLKIKIFPNPASNYIQIYANTKKIKIIKIIDVLGKSMQYKSNKKLIDISKFKNGIYFIIIQTENKITTLKFIKN